MADTVLITPKAPSWTAQLVKGSARFALGTVLIVAWQVSVQSGWINPYLLPAPSDIVLRMGDELWSGYLVSDTLLTIYRAFSGFLIAAAAGIVIGTLAAYNRLAHWFFDPLVSIGFPAPKIAFMPLFVLWFGLGDQAKITMVAVSCVFPIISATYLGTGSIDRYLIWSARNLGVSQRRVIWKIVVPAALPQILSGLQIAFPMSLIVTVVTEMITAGGGLGGYMILSARQAQSEQAFVGILTIAIVGYVLLAAADRLRRYLLRWHTESLSGL
jgi:ABC-type nitrate/sulfonate/bicarbonate transport system permease component